MTNELIGIFGALGLTFLLFALRHLILPSERANKRYVTPMARRENRELNERTAADDAWLLWAPGVEIDARVDRGQGTEPRGPRRGALRFDERHDDGIIGDEIR